MFEYNTQPPKTNDTFSTDEFNLAIRAILMIRGRHQRFGEVRLHFSRQVSSQKQALTNSDEQIANLNQAVVERDGQIASLTPSRSRT